MFPLSQMWVPRTGIFISCSPWCPQLLEESCCRWGLAGADTEAGFSVQVAYYSEPFGSTPVQGRKQKQHTAEGGVELQCWPSCLGSWGQMTCWCHPSGARMAGPLQPNSISLGVTHPGRGGSAAKAMLAGADSWTQQVLSCRAILVTQLCVSQVPGT